VTMGSLPKQRLSDSEIVAQYLAGASQGFLSLKARISQVHIRNILLAHGVRLRTSQETLRLTLRTRRWVPPGKLAG
jgi:hypothetical protein